MSKKLTDILFNIHHVLQCVDNDGGCSGELRSLRICLAKANDLASDIYGTIIDVDNVIWRTPTKSWKDNEPRKAVGYEESATSVCIITEILN